MDFDYKIEDNQVYLTLKETVKEKAKKRKKIMTQTEESLRQMALDRIKDKTGDC
jgi:hypothetical protein